jgi:hemerythrin-like domain-containing protein
MNRRDLLAGIGTGLVLSACSRTNKALAVVAPEQDEEAVSEKVTAVEDLMREHGVLRRALFVYSEAAARLRRNPSEVAPDALTKTAKLFRDFGEDYHEKKLEEKFIFPPLKWQGGRVADLTDILIAQHSRGREITDYILAVTKAGKLDPANIDPLVRAMESMVRMYRPHAAREDTIVFPAWKQVLTARQLNEMGEKFEDIEYKQFGKDGFENAVRQIADIESELGLSELSQFTAPSPPSQ